VSVRHDHEGSALLPVRRERAESTEGPGVGRQAVLAVFGAATVAAEISVRSLFQSRAERRDGPDDTRARESVDELLGSAWAVTWAAQPIASVAMRIMGTAVRFSASPPLVPERWTLGHAARQAAISWRTDRERAVSSLAGSFRTLAEGTQDVAIDVMGLDELLTQAMERVSLQALAEQAVSQLDLDELLATVVSRVDMSRLITEAITDLDLTPIVVRLIEQVDLQAAVDEALDSLDLTDLVLERVDLPRVVTAVLERIDLTELILDQVDLVRITDHVIEVVELPDLIRDSTSSIAAETVREVRLQSVDADRALARLADRVLRRRAEQP
jgi:hypothetical protein